MDANGNIVHQDKDNKWYFWYEDFCNKSLPYNTKEECNVALDKYCRTVLDYEGDLLNYEEEKKLVRAPELEDSSFEKQAKSLIDTPKKQGVFEDIQLPEPSSPQPMRIQKGMTIHFYGFAYKCTAARPNGKVTLKLKGLWKGEANGFKT